MGNQNRAGLYKGSGFLVLLLLTGCSSGIYFIDDGWICRRAYLDDKPLVICDEQTSILNKTQHDEYIIIKNPGGIIEEETQEGSSTSKNEDTDS